MNKLKVLLTILMGTLIAFSAQRAYYVKTGELSSIYSDITVSYTHLTLPTNSLV